MTKYLPAITLSLASLFVVPTTAKAGGTGYSSSRGGHCADSKFQTPRYNQLLPHRHFEDRRRYNAAPCCGESVPVDPYLLKTVVVSRKYLPHYTYDQHGNRRCRKVLTVTYKELYSDGSCYVWTEQA